MRYLSIDIETTGLDPNKHQIIEFAAIFEDTSIKTPIENLPYFTSLVKHPNYNWSLEAYKMNKEIFEEIATSRARDVDFLWSDFMYWVTNVIKTPYVDKLIVAGKNFASFDLRFIKRLPGYQSIFHHRSIDPAIYYLDWEKDTVVPDLKTCLDRAGLNSNVKHRALGDAMQVIQLLRHKYGN